jgi:hypothetical protein
MSARWWCHGRLAVWDGCCYPIRCRGAHSFLKRASQVGCIVVKFREFVAHTVEAARRAIAFEGRVSTLVGAFECVFTGYVASASADPTSFVFRGFGAVLGVVVEQEAFVTLAVRLGDGG